jgi:3-isopropylmalate/(R)-2-methylmalate dehydratase small subunit
MARFETITAVAAPIAMDKIDTDQVLPSRFQSKRREDGAFGSYFLHDLRFDENGRERANFILNDKRLSDVQIIVAAENYACGSGRVGAIYAHIDYGIRAIIAESFGPVFSAVAYKSGLLTIQLDREKVAFLRRSLLENLGACLTIDLPRQRVTAPAGTQFDFEIDPFVKRIIMEGLNEIEFTLALERRIEAFEARQRTALPWVFEPPA